MLPLKKETAVEERPSTTRKSKRHGLYKEKEEVPYSFPLS
jgi:hypothetical protein